MKPKIVIFSCNWSGWSCIESAITSGFHYPSSVKLVRVSCLSRVHSGLILKAYELGADGVMLLGCEPGSCHFSVNDECVQTEYEKARNVLHLLGIPEENLELVRLPAFDGQQFIAQITKFIDTLEQSPAYKRPKTAGSRV